MGVHALRVSSLSPQRLSRISTAVCIVLLAGGVLGFQISQRAYRSNLADHADEPAHFVSGVCFLDYCKTAFGSNPVAFAESYYARYPKVAFGHWPPMFYAVQAVWYELLGASTLNAILLAGFITFIASFTLFRRLQRLHGTWAAALACAAFLWLSDVRSSSLLLMADMLAALFSLLAVLAFCDGLAERRRRCWIAAAVWTVMAILTKESAIYLLILAPLILVIVGGKSLFSRRGILKMSAGFGMVIALTFLFYSVAGVFHLRDSPPFDLTPAGLWTRMPLLAPLVQGASAAFFLAAGFGCVEVLAIKKFNLSPGQRVHGYIALLWLATIIGMQIVARPTVEARYFLPAFFPLTMLFAQGLQWFLRGFPSRLLGVAASMAALAWTIFTIVSTPHVGAYNQRTGYKEIAEAIPSDPLLPAILVSSDAAGEGAIIAERLIGDPNRDGVVLRASKVLSNSDWMGRDQKLLVRSMPEVLGVLNADSVRFVVLDMYGFIDSTVRPHQRLLEDAIRSEPSQFRMIGSFPLYLDGHRRNDAVRVFENLYAVPHPGSVIRIDMTRSLGRSIEVRLSGRQRYSLQTRRSSVGLTERLLGGSPLTHGPPPAFSIAPPKDRISGNEGWGRIYVTARPGYLWSVRGVPAWISVNSGARGEGNGVIEYTLSENRSNEPRWAALSIGEQIFRIIQLRSSTVYTPFDESFSTIWYSGEPDSSPDLGTPDRWILEYRSVWRSTTLAIKTKGTGRGRLLVLDKPVPPDDAPDATVIYLPSVELEESEWYRLSLRVKAQHPGQLLLHLGKGPPYDDCGLDLPIDVSPAWREMTLPFRFPASACESKGHGPRPAAPRDLLTGNRLSIEAGKITGKLWISRVALQREPIEQGAAQQNQGERQSLDQVPSRKSPRLFNKPVKPLQTGLLHP